MAQWQIAATNPPHLAAFAPWNGITDSQRDEVLWGGIPNTFFMKMVASHLTGGGRVERPDEMLARDPRRSPYWADKAAQVERIRAPAYVVTDFVTDLHRMGTAEGFRRLGSKDKWFRVDGRQEWTDQYDPINEADLLRFFDHYMKGVANGWETTPRVRMTLLDPGGANRENVAYTSWPLAATRYTRYHLDTAGMTLSPAAVAKSASASYDSGSGEVSFTHRFDRDTQVTGYVKARLWVEAPQNDDQDLYVLVEKLDKDGKVLPPSPESAAQYFPVPPPGSHGRIRVSYRELDQKASTDWLPVLSLRQPQKVRPGQIVPVDISVLPTSAVFHPGEQIRLVVSGRPFRPLPVPGIKPAPEFAGRPAPTLPSVNKGPSVIHAGGRYDSYLQLPIIGG
jgi:hypothetical protein